MRIVHCESSLGWGGQEMRVLDEAVGLRERGHDVRLVCPAQARICTAARDRGIPVREAAIGRKSVTGLRAMRQALREEAPEVVNTHSSTDSWLATLAVRSTSSGTPIVRTRHISAPIGRNVLTRWLYGGAARVVTTGDALRRDLLAATGLPEQRVVSVPTGVDLSRFVPGDRDAARSALKLPRDAFIVGIVATLRSWKGHATLVDAIAAMKDPALRLLIVGHGPGWDPLHAQVARLNVAPQVVFAGQQDEVVPWLQAMDVFALPSYANEGVPQAIQQAMACARPVVSTAVGAIGEILEDGVNGVMVPPRDPAGLATILRDLRADPERRRRLAMAGRRTAEARCSRQAMLDAMERVFEQARGRLPRDLAHA